MQSPGRPARIRGYTLLEMIVVLVIMGLATALAGTWLFTFIGTWRANVHRDNVLGEIQHLPIIARELGRGLSLYALPAPGTSGAADAVPARVSSAVHLPRDWQVRFDPPLHILGNGACRNAHFVLQGDGRRWGARVEAPFCTVVLDHAKVSP